MKKTLLLLIILLSSNSIYGQEYTIRGKIIDDNLSDLIGVEIKNLTSNLQVFSDESGMFEIKSNKGDSLYFSFIGLTSEKLVISDQSKIKLIMIDRSVNCLGAEWSTRDYKKADKQIQKRLNVLYKKADEKNIWLDLL
ncbi:hypothetical protein [Chondrinema litorale]|uniref:hypothetical protein n=1 Tax=Chondrinema litorale TaxID=2994555 RepID=UPI002542D9F5|nr:hypothetical protein [Chondrinema litorale]UZR97215.1 hypothetical protein OQ292_25280 [Chondrinema litorale]